MPVLQMEDIPEEQRTHLDLCVDWLHAELTARLLAVGQHLDQTCGKQALSTVKIRCSMMDNCWDDNGSLTLDSEAVKIVGQMDVTVELMKVPGPTSLHQF
jgi:hypothetical protein